MIRRRPRSAVRSRAASRVAAPAALLLSAAVLSFACGDEPPPVRVALVQIDPEALDLEVGATANLVATAFDEAGTKVRAGAVRWTSGDPSVASVDFEGTLLGVAVGETTISAAIGEWSGTASVRVTPAKVATVSVEPAEARLFPDETLQLEAAAFTTGSDRIDNRAVNWTSDSPDVASVSDSGLVRGKAPGVAEIVATVDGVMAGARVVVVPRVAAIRIAPERLLIFEGEAGALVATAVGTNGEVLEDREIVWSSAAPAIARVEAGGAIVAVSPGETPVYAEVEGVVGMAMVEVRARPASVRIEPASLLLQVGTTWGLSAIVTDTIGGEHGGEGCAWSSTAPEVIRIFDDGSVHTLAEGEASIEVRCEGKHASIDATVIPRAELTIVGPGKAVVGEDRIRLEVSMEGRTARGQVDWAWGPPDRLDRLEDGSWRGLRPGRPWVFAAAEGRSAGRVILSVLRFDELFAGPWATCGRGRHGRMYCWGDTRLYAEGETASYPSPEPKPVDDPRFLGISEIWEVSLGETFGTARLSNGTAEWGCRTDCYDESRGSAVGFLPGNPSAGGSSPGYSVLRIRPPPEKPLLSASHSCSLSPGGTVACGEGLIPDAFPSTFVHPDQRFVAIGAGLASNCALTAEGETWCWGRGGIDDVDDTAFVLGNGSLDPAPLAGAPAFRSISAGKYHHCGVTEAGAAWCWGHSRLGALGAGSPGSSETPVEVAGGHAFRYVAASIEHTCGLTVGGEVYCWGRGDDEPVQIPLEGTIRQVVTGAGHACALRDDGVAYCWGDNGRFQAGDDVAEVAWPPRPVYPENR